MFVDYWELILRSDWSSDVCSSDLGDDGDGVVDDGDNDPDEVQRDDDDDDDGDDFPSPGGNFPGRISCQRDFSLSMVSVP